MTGLFKQQRRPASVIYWSPELICQQMAAVSNKTQEYVYT